MTHVELDGADAESVALGSDTSMVSGFDDIEPFGESSTSFWLDEDRSNNEDHFLTSLLVPKRTQRGKFAAVANTVRAMSRASLGRRRSSLASDSQSLSSPRRGTVAPSAVEQHDTLVTLITEWCETEGAGANTERVRKIKTLLEGNPDWCAGFFDSKAVGRLAGLGIKIITVLPAARNQVNGDAKISQGLEILFTAASSPAFVVPRAPPDGLLDCLSQLLSSHSAIPSFFALKLIAKFGFDFAAPSCRYVFENAASFPLKVTETALFTVAEAAGDERLDNPSSWIPPILVLLQTFIQTTLNDEIISLALDILDAAATSASRDFLSSNGVDVVHNALLSASKDTLSTGTVVRFLKLLDPSNLGAISEPGLGGTKTFSGSPSELSPEHLEKISEACLAVLNRFCEDSADAAVLEQVNYVVHSIASIGHDVVKSSLVDSLAAAAVRVGISNSDLLKQTLSNILLFPSTAEVPSILADQNVIDLFACCVAELPDDQAFISRMFRAIYPFCQTDPIRSSAASNKRFISSLLFGSLEGVTTEFRTGCLAMLAKLCRHSSTACATLLDAEILPSKAKLNAITLSRHELPSWKSVAEEAVPATKEQQGPSAIVKQLTTLLERPAENVSVLLLLLRAVLRHLLANPAVRKTDGALVALLRTLQEATERLESNHAVLPLALVCLGHALRIEECSPHIQHIGSLDFALTLAKSIKSKPALPPFARSGSLDLRRKGSITSSDLPSPIRNMLAPKNLQARKSSVTILESSDEDFKVPGASNPIQLGLGFLLASLCESGTELTSSIISREGCFPLIDTAAQSKDPLLSRDERALCRTQAAKLLSLEPKAAEPQHSVASDRSGPHPIDSLQKKMIEFGLKEVSHDAARGRERIVESESEFRDILAQLCWMERKQLRFAPQQGLVDLETRSRGIVMDLEQFGRDRIGNLLFAALLKQLKAPPAIPTAQPQRYSDLGMNHFLQRLEFSTREEICDLEREYRRGLAAHRDIVTTLAATAVQKPKEQVPAPPVSRPSHFDPGDGPSLTAMMEMLAQTQVSVREIHSRLAELPSGGLTPTPPKSKSSLRQDSAPRSRRAPAIEVIRSNIQLRSNLRKIDLSDVFLGDKGLIFLVPVLKNPHSPFLSVLSLRHCGLSTLYLQQLLFGALLDKSEFRALDLSGNRDITPRAGKDFILFTREKRTLLSLNLVDTQVFLSTISIVNSILDEREMFVPVPFQSSEEFVVE